MDLILLKSLRPLYCDYISRILCVRRAQQRRPPRPPFMYFYSRPYARGDPRQSHEVVDQLIDFYSRPYARGDGGVALCRQPGDLISTHAPTRGATGVWPSVVRRATSFLLTPLREGRPGPDAGRP